MAHPHGSGGPSAWITRWSHLIRPGGHVLDVACGGGRHLRWLQSQGFALTGVDHDAHAVQPLAAIAEVIVADIENSPWPLAGRLFDAVVVTNYMWRPLLPTLVASLAEGGVLLYETFADGQASVGKPSRPDFLLRHGELLEATRGLRVIAFEDGFLPEPERFLQRIVACRAPHAAAEAPRYRL